MSNLFKCDICGKEAEKRTDFLPVYLTLGELNRETQNNFERLDFCLECWPKNRRAWRGAFLGSMKKLVIQELKALGVKNDNCPSL